MSYYGDSCLYLLQVWGGGASSPVSARRAEYSTWYMVQGTHPPVSAVERTKVARVQSHASLDMPGPDCRWLAQREGGLVGGIPCRVFHGPGFFQRQAKPGSGQSRLRN
ncbi:hypothetical protein LY78DRAFT_654903 [Colletotrichum sublineola]|nr:hypothetical protein LY78DRAFT_654903 [Colletotrichum sublineola]